MIVRISNPFLAAIFAVVTFTAVPTQAWAQDPSTIQEIKAEDYYTDFKAALRKCGGKLDGCPDSEAASDANEYFSDLADFISETVGASNASTYIRNITGFARNAKFKVSASTPPSDDTPEVTPPDDTPVTPPDNRRRRRRRRNDGPTMVTDPYTRAQVPQGSETDCTTNGLINCSDANDKWCGCPPDKCDIRIAYPQTSANCPPSNLCDEEGVCGDHGTCNRELNNGQGGCECTDNYTGERCENAPVVTDGNPTDKHAWDWLEGLQNDIATLAKWTAISIFGLVGLLEIIKFLLGLIFPWWPWWPMRKRREKEKEKRKKEAEEAVGEKLSEMSSGETPEALATKGDLDALDAKIHGMNAWNRMNELQEAVKAAEVRQDEVAAELQQTDAAIGDVYEALQQPLDEHVKAQKLAKVAELQKHKAHCEGRASALASEIKSHKEKIGELDSETEQKLDSDDEEDKGSSEA